MSERFPPHWLDGVIESAGHLLGEETGIVRAIANSRQLHDAIERGISAANSTNPKDKGPSRAQCIRQVIVDRFNNP